MKSVRTILQNYSRTTMVAGAVCLGAVAAGINFASGQYTGKVNLQRGRAAADSISAMLQAFPFLFPRSTNTWTPGATADPARSTFADPHIWDEFDFFYKEAQAASKYALEASRAENETDFRKSVTQLRQTCDTCHAAFQKNS
jgi:cytochrome c556